MTNIESKLLEIFSAGQIKKLKQGTKRLNWTEKDIARSITLYSASAKAYKLLRKKMFPLPSVRTLQWWAKKIEISPGILKLCIVELIKSKIGIYLNYLLLFI